MRVLLLHITLRRSGARARKGEHVEAERLTVGRGTDNVLHIPGLSVALHHCVLQRLPDGIYVEAVDAHDLRVNGNVTAGTHLKLGDVVRVGQHELRVKDVESSLEDLVLEVEEVAASGAGSFRSRMRIGIERGLLQRRVLSWALGATILLVLLGIPLLHRATLPTGDEASVHPRPPAKSVFGAAAVAIESHWTSGPLARNHSHLAGDCAACHAAGFEPVRDRECVVCHAAMGRHTAMEIPLEEIESVRCASCHVEHEGESGLYGSGSQLCTSCHADIARKFPESKLLDVRGLSEGHPDFRPSLVVDPESGERLRVARVDLLRPAGTEDDASLGERSGLAFSHVAHLGDPLPNRRGEDVDLDCVDCHAPERGRALMRPVVYEDHCQSCHGLELEPGSEREAPHGSAEQIRRALREFYSGVALGGDALTTSARRKAAPIPADREGARAWAESRAAAVERRLLGAGGTCAFCHTIVERDGRAEVSAVLLPPTPPADRWFPLARFEHGPHEAAKCSSCHDVSAAKTSAGVAMPGIDRCLDCHGDRGKAAEVASPCIACHDFHHTGTGIMGTGPGTGPANRSTAIVPATEAPAAPMPTEPPPPEPPSAGESPQAVPPEAAATDRAEPGSIADGATLHAAPDPAAEVIGDFEGEARVEILEQRGDWSRVRAPVLPAGSIEGWVPSERVAPAASRGR